MVGTLNYTVPSANNIIIQSRSSKQTEVPYKTVLPPRIGCKDRPFLVSLLLPVPSIRSEQPASTLLWFLFSHRHRVIHINIVG